MWPYTATLPKSIPSLSLPCVASRKPATHLGIREYREIFFKPYRMIYRIADGTIYVLLFADGRRDMQALLQRRLLES